MNFKDLSAGSTKNLLKIEPGEAVRGVLSGEPVDFRQHWIGNRSVVCTGYESCEHCANGEKSSFRFKINFIINENGSYLAKTLQGGRGLYEQLRALSKDYELDKHAIKITRTGSGKDSKYGVVPVPNGMLSEEQLSKLSQVKLNELS